MMRKSSVTGKLYHMMTIRINELAKQYAFSRYKNMETRDENPLFLITDTSLV